MSDVASCPFIPSSDGELAREAACLEVLTFPTSRMPELVDGPLVILPMLNLKHQRMLKLRVGRVEDEQPAGGRLLPGLNVDVDALLNT